MPATCTPPALFYTIVCPFKHLWIGHGCYNAPARCLWQAISAARTQTAQMHGSTVMSTCRDHRYFTIWHQCDCAPAGKGPTRAPEQHAGALMHTISPPVGEKKRCMHLATILKTQGIRSQKIVIIPSTENWRVGMQECKQQCTDRAGPRHAFRWAGNSAYVMLDGTH